MRRSSLRLTLFLIAILLLGGFLAYDAWRKQSGAEDILSMQGVVACSTDRDFQSGKHSCPGKTTFVINCDEAKSAVAGLTGLKLLSQTSQVLPQNESGTDCELKTVSKEEGVYALLLHTYYSVTASPSGPIDDGNVRSQALSSLYSTYSNLYQSYLALDISTTSVSQGIGGSGLFQSFTPAFLIKGEPGFRMRVQTESEKGEIAPSAGSLITVSCGDASDTMVAEPDGNSWFSFEGYEKLNCGTKPLTAQVVVEKDRSGRWIRNTPSYSYAYVPETATNLTPQNRPQPVQAGFIGKWQGLGSQVKISSYTPSGQSQSAPLAGIKVSFTCTQLAPPSGTLGATIEETTDADGRASVSLADAQLTLASCEPESYITAISNYDPAAALPEDSPAYDYFFTNAGPVPAGHISGSAFTGGQLQGQELQIGGKVRIADVGSTPGGAMTSGSQICIFYSPEAANAVKGCPAEPRTATSQTLNANDAGEYYFGGSPSTRISYGNYRKAGSNKVLVRVLKSTNDPWPVDVVAGNDQPLNPAVFNARDITLPAGEDDLKDHVCLAVLATWHDRAQCEPLLNIIFRESRWDVNATNSSSGACGLFQSNPCSKYQSTALPGENYRSIGNQIRWGVLYIRSRYGNPANAWQFWLENKHY